MHFAVAAKRWGQIDSAHWVIVGLIIALTIWGLTDVRRRGRIDPQHPWVHKTDFTVYTIAGQAMLHGRNPYSVSSPRGWKYLYPPLFALLVSPLGTLSPQTQVIIWYVVSVLCCWGCYSECLRIAHAVLPEVRPRKLFGPVPNWVGVAAVAAAVLPALNCLQRGQVGILVLYFLLLGYRLLIESRSITGSFVAAAVLAIPVVIKVTPLLPVIVALFLNIAAAWYTRRCFPDLIVPLCGVAGWLAGMIGLLLIVPTLLIGWQANVTHLETWWSTVARREENARTEDFAGDSTSERNQSLTNSTYRFVDWLAGHPEAGVYCGRQLLPQLHPQRTADSPAEAELLLLVRAGFALMLAAVIIRIRIDDPLTRTVGFCIANLSTVLLCQIARGHYFMFWMPTVLFAGMWLLRCKRPIAAACLTISPAILVVTHYVFLDQAGRIGLLGLGTAAWFLAMGLFLFASNCRLESRKSKGVF